MTEHTKEPWIVEGCTNEYFDIYSPEQPGCSAKLVASCSLTDTEANARRIVACVNACTGISTRTLENLEEKTLNELFKRQETEYQAQRDKLLTILTLVLDTHIYTGDDGEEASDNARLLIAEIEATK
jgi:hypothetical protein